MSMQVHTTDPAKAFPVTVGEVIGNCFVKTVVSSKHKLRIFPAYGIQEDVFNKLPDFGVSTIVINEDHVRSYQIAWDKWKEHAVVRDFGNGKQSFLSMKYIEEGKA